jgi:mannosyltransferase
VNNQSSQHFSIARALDAANFASRSVKFQSVALLPLLLLAAWLRFYDLHRTSLWFAESVSWSQARLPFFEMIRATAQDNYPPLHNIILFATIRLFGDSEMALRTPSALLGVATVYVLYRLGSLLWDNTTGIIAALFLTISGFHVWYSTEARMYALLAFTATLFVLGTVRVIRHPSNGSLAACTAAATALLYSHVYGSFVFAGVNIAVIAGLIFNAAWIKIDWRRWLATQFLSALLFLPWAIILFRRMGVVMQGFWIPEPTIPFALQQLHELAGGPIALTILAILSSIALFKIRIFQHGAHPTGSRDERTWVSLRLDWQNSILCGWFVTPIVAGYLVSLVGQSIFFHNYLICVLPAVFLLGARGLTLLTHRPFIFMAIPAIAFFPNLKYQAFERLNDDHRSAAREFSQHYLPGDRVIFLSEAKKPFRYYFRRPITNSINRSIKSISAKDLDTDRFWLITLWDEGHELNQFIYKLRPYTLIFKFSRTSNMEKWPSHWEMPTRPGSPSHAEVYLFQRNLVKPKD